MDIDRQTELAIVRRAYAKQTMAAARILNPRIEAAFAAIPREDFLGPGPWQIMRMLGAGYAETPAADPVYLYVDLVIGLVPERRLNNGQPSFHAALLNSVDIKEGGHVVHVGAGTGYYTAIMAHLAGSAGRVTAIEFDPDLAARARETLAPFSNTTVLEADGTTAAFDSADVIYVNAGVTRLMPTWLDGLKEGGRLLFPLTTDYNFQSAKPGVIDPMKLMNSGAYFQIQRHGRSLRHAESWARPSFRASARVTRSPRRRWRLLSRRRAGLGSSTWSAAGTCPRSNVGCEATDGASRTSNEYQRAPRTDFPGRVVTALSFALRRELTANTPVTRASCWLWSMTSTRLRPCTLAS